MTDWLGTGETILFPVESVQRDRTGKHLQIKIQTSDRLCAVGALFTVSNDFQFCFYSPD